MFFNKENNNPKKQEIDKSFFDDLNNFYKTGNFNEENKEKPLVYYIDNNKFQINEILKNNCFSFMDKSSFKIQYNEKEYLVQHFFDKDYYKNDEIFNIQRLNHDDCFPSINLIIGDRKVNIDEDDEKIKQFFSEISIDFNHYDFYFSSNYEHKKNAEIEVENEYKPIVDIINKYFNTHFKFHEDFTCTFEEKLDDNKNTLSINIDSQLTDDDVKHYEIDLNKKDKEIYFIDYDNNDVDPISKKIYSSHEKNIVGTNINICEVDLENFPQRLYEAINFVNNEKYNFMDFNYKSFDDFKNSVKNIEKSSEHVDKNEYEK
nr:MAG TPA: hypothetical protein [Caudoviricetes sp.]